MPTGKNGTIRTRCCDHLFLVELGARQYPQTGPGIGNSCCAQLLCLGTFRLREHANSWNLRL